MADHRTATTKPHAAKTPAELAEAPPTTGAHPAVVDRLVELMDDLTNLVDTSDVATFVADGPWDASGRLAVSLEKVRLEAELHRRPDPTLYPRF